VILAPSKMPRLFTIHAAALHRAFQFAGQSVAG
jgi:hypothetical protein